MIEVLNISVLVLRKSSRRLLEAFILILFFGSVYILLGKQLYKGVLAQKCVKIPPQNISHYDYAEFVANSSHWLEDKNGYFMCGNSTGARPCPSTYVCLKGAEINSFYASNFNFYGSSVVTVSQIMTLHFWQELYQRMLITAGPFHVTYLLFALYTFLYLNGLILAILTRSYKQVTVELDAPQKVVAVGLRENTRRSDTPKGIVKSPSCKSYELFISQVKNPDVIEHCISEDDVFSRESFQRDIQHESRIEECTIKNKSLKESEKEQQPKENLSGSQRRNKADHHLTCMQCWQSIQKKLEIILSDPVVEIFILVLIIFNSSLMALHHYDMNNEVENILKLVYYVFAGLSLLEAVLKIITFGPERYFSNKWNTFDFIILLSAGIELAIPTVELPVLFIFRILKLIQIFQLMCSLTCCYLNDVMICALTSFGHPSIVLAVFMAICIVSGMNLYGLEYFSSRDRFPEEKLPRWFFKDCYSSFMLVFCMLCGDWKQPMVNAVLFTSCASDLLLLIFVLVGNLIVINLFLGLVFYLFFYKPFSRSLFLQDSKLQMVLDRILCKLKAKDAKSEMKDRNLSEEKVNQESKSKTEERAINSSIASASFQEILSEDIAIDLYQRGRIRGQGLGRNHREMEIIEDTSSEYMADCCPALCYFCCSFCRPDRNPVFWQTWADLRCRIYSMVENKIFRITLTIIIIGSVVIPVIDKSFGAFNPSLTKAASFVELSIMLIFILEMLLKWMAYGLQKYFGSPLGRLEFVIIIVYVADFLTIEIFNGQSNIFKSLRAFRLLSVLQLLKSYQELPPLPLKRTSCAIGSEAASRESLLRLKRIECDHFLGRHCRYKQSESPDFSSQEIGNKDWIRTSTSYSGDVQNKVIIPTSRNSVATTIEGTTTISRTVDCFPNCCYIMFPCCKKNCIFWHNWKVLRLSTYYLVENKYFQGLIVCIICFSSFTLAIEDIHVNRRSFIMNIVTYADKVLVGLFLLEMHLKWLAYGFKKYFGDHWCFLEFVTAVTSSMYLILNEFDLGYFPVLKIIRIIRLLWLGKALFFNKQVQLVLKAVGQAVPLYFIALFLCLFLWLPFGILGVMSFNGKFYRCFDKNHEVILNISSKNYERNCLSMNQTLQNSPVNFDNVVNSYIALLQVATLQDWISLVTNIMDSSKQANYLMAKIYTALYFPSFIIFSTFLTTNFFVGVAICKFNQLKKEAEQSFFNESQKLYHLAVQKMKQVKLNKAIPQPHFQLQSLVYRMVTSDNFEIAGFVFIGLHMLLIALDMYDPDPSEMFALAMTELNIFFIIIFSVECVLKLIALRLYYFTQFWNIFDILVLTFCIMGVLFEDILVISPVLPAMLRLLRFIKSLRYFRRYMRGVVALTSTLYLCLPTLLAICILQFLVMFIYAVFGMHFFRNIKQGWDISGELNFDTFARSMLLLFQLSILAGWKDVLLALEGNTSCQAKSYGDGGHCSNKIVAVIYIVSYIIIVYFVIIKAHIIAILDNYECSIQEAETSLLKEDYKMFTEVWQRFDCDASGIIKFSTLSDLLDVMEEPFHFGKPNKFLIVSLNIPIYEGDIVFYRDIMDALTRDFLAQNGHIIEEPINTPCLLDTNGRKINKISSSLWRQRQNFSARVIQHSWKKYKGQLALSESPVIYSEVRLAMHGNKVDTFLASHSSLSDHSSV